MADIFENELENLLKIFSNPNPFKEVQEGKPRNFIGRLFETFRVFNGLNADTRWWTTPFKGHHGIFSYLLGIPSQLVYAILPYSLLFLTNIATQIILQLIQLPATIINNISSTLALILLPVWLAVLIAVVAIGITGALVGYVGYGVTKAALYPVNLLIQNLIMPTLSLLATAIVLPIVGIVSLFKDKDSAPYQPQNNNTGDSYKYLYNGRINPPSLSERPIVRNRVVRQEREKNRAEPTYYDQSEEYQAGPSTRPPGFRASKYE